MHFAIVDYLSDLVENSLEANASLVVVDWLQSKDKLEIYIADNGKGIANIEQALDPFFSDGKKHLSRTVGLGLAFLKQLLDQTNGKFEIESQVDFGTSQYLLFDLNNIDIPPIGDIVATMLSLFTKNLDYELIFNKQNGTQKYQVLRSDLIDIFEDLNRIENLKILKDYFLSLESDFSV